MDKSTGQALHFRQPGRVKYCRGAGLVVLVELVIIAG